MTFSSLRHGIMGILFGVNHAKKKEINKGEAQKAIHHALEVIHDNDGISISDLNSICSEIQNVANQNTVIYLRSMLYFENGRYYMPDNKSQYEVEKLLVKSL